MPLKKMKKYNNLIGFSFKNDTQYVENRMSEFICYHIYAHINICKAVLFQQFTIAFY